MSRWPQSSSASSESTTDPWSITKPGLSLALSTVANLIYLPGCFLTCSRNSRLSDQVRRVRTERLAGRREGRHDFGIHLVGARRNADRPEELPVVVADIAIIGNLAVFECLLHLADTVVEIQCAIKAELALNFLERHAIVAAVGVLHLLDLSIREVFANLGGDVRQGVVQIGAADVEDLTADKAERRIHDVNTGCGDVTYMDKRAPLCAVENRDRTFLMGLGREQVHNEVEAGAVRETKDRRKAQNGGVEIFIPGSQQRLLGIHLRLRVKGDGTHGRSFIRHLIGCAVHAAARGEQEALDAE